ncbi:hypothetical protein PDESU_06408 [Pontiella desulfatans]|uniref:Lipocalin-like domain-containing protein n=1 Tax=Pontiella desulfatans TaxID=2750659 RepID=A0A6C2UF23_PONDE|nr:hypothetical protein [Pontiella desulfatans]VGO17806.1 hypothetical protein PDESU_06408 [Pontiella desulfatans]
MKMDGGIEKVVRRTVIFALIIIGTFGLTGCNGDGGDDGGYGDLDSSHLGEWVIVEVEDEDGTRTSFPHGTGLSIGFNDGYCYLYLGNVAGTGAPYTASGNTVEATWTGDTLFRGTISGNTMTGTLTDLDDGGVTRFKATKA